MNATTEDPAVTTGAGRSARRPAIALGLAALGVAAALWPGLMPVAVAVALAALVVAWPRREDGMARGAVALAAVALVISAAWAVGGLSTGDGPTGPIEVEQVS